MKFYGHGVIWDPEKNKRLMKFVDGTFETEDKYIIAKLEKNYKHDGKAVIDVEYKVVETEPVEGYKNYERVEETEPEPIEIIPEPKPAQKKPAARRKKK